MSEDKSPSNPPPLPSESMDALVTLTSSLPEIFEKEDSRINDSGFQLFRPASQAHHSSILNNDVLPLPAPLVSDRNRHSNNDTYDNNNNSISQTFTPLSLAQQHEGTTTSVLDKKTSSSMVVLHYQAARAMVPPPVDASINDFFSDETEPPPPLPSAQTVPFQDRSSQLLKGKNRGSTKSTIPPRATRSFSTSSLLPSKLSKDANATPLHDLEESGRSGLHLDGTPPSASTTSNQPSKQGGWMQRLKRISLFPGTLLLNRQSTLSMKKSSNSKTFPDLKAPIPRNATSVMIPAATGKYLTCYFCQKPVFFPASISLVQCKNCGKNIMQTIANLKVGVLMGANAARSDGSLYVRMSLSGQAARTRIVKGGSMPKWEEEFLFRVSDIEQHLTLKIQLASGENQVSANDTVMAIWKMPVAAIRASHKRKHLISFKWNSQSQIMIGSLEHREEKINAFVDWRRSVYKHLETRKSSSGDNPKLPSFPDALDQSVPSLLLELELIPIDDYYFPFQDRWLVLEERRIAMEPRQLSIPFKVILNDDSISRPDEIMMKHCQVPPQASVKQVIPILLNFISPALHESLDLKEDLCLTEIIEGAERIMGSEEVPFVIYTQVKEGQEDVLIFFGLRTRYTCIRDRILVKQEGGRLLDAGMSEERRKSIQSLHHQQIQHLQRKRLSGHKIEATEDPSESSFPTNNLPKPGWTASRDLVSSKDSPISILKQPIQINPNSNQAEDPDSPVKSVSNVSPISSHVQQQAVSGAALADPGISVHRIRELEEQVTLKDREISILSDRIKELRNGLKEANAHANRPKIDTFTSMSPRGLVDSEELRKSLTASLDAAFNSNIINSKDDQDKGAALEKLRSDVAQLQEKLDQTEKENIFLKQEKTILIDQTSRLTDTVSSLQERLDSGQQELSLTVEAHASEKRQFCERIDELEKLVLVLQEQLLSEREKMNDLNQQAKITRDNDRGQEEDESRNPETKSQDDEIMEKHDDGGEKAEDLNFFQSLSPIVKKSIPVPNVERIEEVSNTLSDNTNASSASTSGVVKVKRRIRFDPCILVLDAALEGNLTELQAILKGDGEAVADVNICNEDGITALHCASCNGHLEVVEWLISQAGANVNAVDVDGWSPLHGATCLGDLKVIEALINHGANVEAKTSENELPEHLAESRPVYEILKRYRDKKYSSSCVKAIYDFDPKEEDPEQMLGNELTISKGQLLQVLSREEGDWWLVESETGKKGFVPANHIQ